MKHYYEPIAKGVNIKLPAPPGEIAKGILMLVKTWNQDHHNVFYRTEIRETADMLTVEFQEMDATEASFLMQAGIMPFG